MLTDLQTRWVRAFISNGFNATAAARTAGYGEHAKSGWRMKNSLHVMAAVHNALGSDNLTRLLPLLRKNVIDIAKNPVHKDHLKACFWLLGMAGMSPKLPKREQKVETIERTINPLNELKRLSARLGVDPRKLISGAN
jgi:hypothetical protein